MFCQGRKGVLGRKEWKLNFQSYLIHISFLLYPLRSVKEPSGPHLRAIPMWEQSDSFMPLLLPNSRICLEKKCVRLLQKKWCQCAPEWNVSGCSNTWPSSADKMKTFGLVNNLRFWSFSWVHWPQEVIYLGLGLQPVVGVWPKRISSTSLSLQQLAERGSTKPLMYLLSRAPTSLTMSMESLFFQPNVVS